MWVHAARRLVWWAVGAAVTGEAEVLLCLIVFNHPYPYVCIHVRCSVCRCEQSICDELTQLVRSGLGRPDGEGAVKIAVQR